MIVDNSIISFAFNLANGIPIKAFLGDEANDEELLYMVTFLEEIYSVNDVRDHIKRTFKLEHFSQKYAGQEIRNENEGHRLIQDAQESLHIKNAP